MRWIQSQCENLVAEDINTEIATTPEIKKGGTMKVWITREEQKEIKLRKPTSRPQIPRNQQLQTTGSAEKLREAEFVTEADDRMDEAT